MDIAQKIKETRIKQSIPQEELANLTGLNIRTIQRIENGETTPRGDSLKRILKCLNIEHIASESSISIYMLCIFASSTLGLYFTPLFIIVPLIIWFIFKDKLELGQKKIVKYLILILGFVAVFYITNQIIVKSMQSKFSEIQNVSLKVINNYNYLSIGLGLFINTILIFIIGLYCSKIKIEKQTIYNFDISYLILIFVSPITGLFFKPLFIGAPLLLILIFSNKLNPMSYGLKNFILFQIMIYGVHHLSSMIFTLRTNIAIREAKHISQSILTGNIEFINHVTITLYLINIIGIAIFANKAYKIWKMNN
jgi:transcriptional regulator with XRE-family HTH domain